VLLALIDPRLVADQRSVLVGRFRQACFFRPDFARDGSIRADPTQGRLASPP
jgi:hypothetical protein